MKVETNTSNSKSETFLRILPDVCLEAYSTNTASSLWEMIIFIHKYLVEIDLDPLHYGTLDEESEEFMTSVVSILQEMYNSTQTIKYSFRKLSSIQKEALPKLFISKFQNINSKQNNSDDKDKTWAGGMSFKNSIDVILQDNCFDGIIADILHLSQKKINHILKYNKFPNISQNELSLQKLSKQLKIETDFFGSKILNLQCEGNIIRQNEITENKEQKYSKSHKVLPSTYHQLRKGIYQQNFGVIKESNTPQTQTEIIEHENKVGNRIPRKRDEEEGYRRCNSSTAVCTITTFTSLPEFLKIRSSQEEHLKNMSVETFNKIKRRNDLGNSENPIQNYYSNHYSPNTFKIPTFNDDNDPGQNITVKNDGKIVNFNKTKIWIGGKWYLQGVEGFTPAYCSITTNNDTSCSHKIQSEESKTTTQLPFHTFSHISETNTKRKIWMGGKWYLQDKHGLKEAYPSSQKQNTQNVELVHSYYTQPK